MLILVINSGSSSLKYQLRELNDDGTDAAEPIQASGLIERIGVPGAEIANHTEALDIVAKELDEVLNGRTIDATGHRVVHGGERFKAPALVDAEVIRAIDRLAPLAPLHNPPATEGLRALSTKWPEMPQVVIFDTSFHQTMPPQAWRYAVPNSWYTDYGIRRYGFHGTSHDLVTGKTAELLGVPRKDFTGIILHLGNGASATAIKHGRSVDTSMGYTPLAGLVMGTRSGDVDPSIISHLGTSHGFTAQAIDRVLNHESGLLGMTGHADMRQVLESAEAGQREAQVALEVTTYRLAKYIGGYHVAIDGAQAITFTAGIGENSAPFRARVLDRLGVLGIKYDPALNESPSDDSRLISTTDSAIAVAVVPTDEEMAIAQETFHMVNNANAWGRGVGV
ncbi:acetate/propionate family kinase [Enteractinococcus coprophilus]|uniref:Acetate kinase n=1 Tax=Enteractinococcus coprophilus TaxID=1027633 RepID=A0A543AGM5_9MICC|nr:acetate kinase [Enteractinococcus coprophilus]TQL71738.1 acetate kinase [Enteractinococcus coprophilus]